MHEMSIARPLAEEISQKAKGNKPVKVIIVIGKASGVNSEFLEHSFVDHIFPETGWSDTKLVFESEEPSLTCSKCGHKTDNPIMMKCPACGCEYLDISGGNRVYIKEVICREE